MNSDADPPQSGWRDLAVRRCKTTIKAARSSADRLALLRSLLRLSGGRLSLPEHDLSLSAAEISLLKRFGLALTSDQQVLRILTEEDPVKGLSQALTLDPATRQVVDIAPADGILISLTDHKHYRSEAQKAAVRALLTQPAGSGLMVSMPTGSGKSLLFQLAALHGRKRDKGSCAIVITPTIALALDHQRTLRKIPGLEGSGALTGDTSPKDADNLISAFRRGEVPVLLLSPEKALSHGLIKHLTEAAQPGSPLYGLDARLTHLFVDEAHIVESWGRSFRPDFQRLPGLLAELRAVNPAVRAVLLSATLPPAARDVLVGGWKLGAPWLEVEAKTPRYEHDVVAASFEFAEERDEALLALIDRAPRPAIIYTTEVDQASDLADLLKDQRGYRRIALFTGETRAAERQRIVEAWAADEYDLVVATSAFGMGIDKPDVRSVIHACLPESPARWYQEIGRASRDRGQGLAACLFTSGLKNSDVSAAYSLAMSGWLSRELAEDRWSKLRTSASEQRWDEQGRLRLMLDLDVVREALRRRTSDYNRGWNMALLTLMQRAGVIQVRAVASEGDQAGNRWDVEILEPAILGADPSLVWDQVFAVREAERARARAELKPFETLMRHPGRQCVTRAVFELIEPYAFAPPCGRCPHCRANDIAPPDRLPCGGLESAWTIDAPNLGGDLPGGVLLLEPEDPAFGLGLPRLIERLASAQIEQVIASGELVGEVAKLLSSADAIEVGFVLSADDVAPQTQFAAVPTAILLPDRPPLASFLIDKIRAFSEVHPDLPVLVVARGDRTLGERRLDQTVSKGAPILEQVLDEIAKSKMEGV